MPKRSSIPPRPGLDPIAPPIAETVTDPLEDEKQAAAGKNPAAVALGKLGAASAVPGNRDGPPE
jgi:hypothetical protein